MNNSLKSFSKQPQVCEKIFQKRSSINTFGEGKEIFDMNFYKSFLDQKMPGFLKASLNVQQAHALLNKFILVEPENLFSGEIEQRLHRINAILLYANHIASV